jgi:hypothetical protein
VASDVIKAIPAGTRDTWATLLHDPQSVSGLSPFLEHALTLTRHVLPALVALAMMGTAAPAFAEMVHFSAPLTGGDEVPANDSAGTGQVDADFDSVANTLNYTITYSGLTGAATAAHFHGPAKPGKNAKPVVPIKGDLTSPISGTATLTDDQEADLLGGMWYFNVHTAQHPDGELRGQVLQAAASGMSSMESSMMESSSMSSETSSSSMMDSSMMSSSMDPSMMDSSMMDSSMMPSSSMMDSSMMPSSSMMDSSMMTPSSSMMVSSMMPSSSMMSSSSAP